MLNMKRIAAVITLGLAIAASIDRLSAQSGYDLFQKALATERADGNLQQAIQLYGRVVKEFAADRALAARALVRMAECYQKLGDAEAQKIYERLLRDYADQQEAVTIARARLRGPERTGGSPVTALRRIWSGPEVAVESYVSADGRFVSYPAWATGDLGLHDLATGTSRLLTNNNYARNEYAQGSSISSDGRQVAYAWYNGTDRYELRAMSLQGSSPPRRLFDNPDVDFLVPFDWSPDGKWIATWLQRKDRTSQIGLVSTSDGSLRVLKSIDWRGVLRMSLSPDSRHLAFDLPTSDTDSNERDIFVLSVDGSREVRAVEYAGHDRVMGWSPDGTTLLFGSDRTGTLGLWGLAFANGQVAGTAFFIKPDIAGWSIGVSKSGTLFTMGTLGSVDVKVTSVDLNTGKPLAAAESVVRTFVGVNRAPDWSPDGRSLAYISVRGLGSRERVIVIRSLETGLTRELPVELDYSGQLRWAPDSRSFVVKGRDLKGNEGVFRVDAQTGQSTRLVSIPSSSGNSFPELSPDGTKLYFWTGDVLRGTPGSRFVERDLASGTERTLYGTGGPIYPTLSPDGRHLAGVIQDEQSRSSALVVWSVIGDKRKELLRTKERQSMSNYVSWTPDGSGVIVPVRRTGAYDPVVVPVAGGAPRTLDLEIGQLGLRVHPDGRQVAFTTGQQTFELWMLENFLPASAAQR